MTLTNDLNNVTKITIRPTPTDASLHEVLIERDIGQKENVKWQMFLTDDAMISLEDTISAYNRALVDYN